MPRPAPIPPASTTVVRAAAMRALVVGELNMTTANATIAAAGATLTIYCNGARIKLSDGRKFTRVGEGSVAAAMTAAGL